MIGLGVWQNLLQALGWVLARLYDLIPSYAVSIILLTVFIRLLLLPLGIKQVRSMHAMTRLQPKVKAIQTKYKGNRPRQQEEIQKLYQEHGVSPLGGCLPMILQIPVLIALYSVLRFPTNVGAHPENQPPPLPTSHIPVASSLYSKIISPGGEVRWLLCSAGQAGSGTVELPTGGNTPVVAAPPGDETNLKDSAGNPVVKVAALDCGSGIPVRIPYYALAIVMVFTTYYQSRQMQKVNPSGSQQQQTLTRVMPLLFGVWGFLFPAGLVVYWTTSNLWQIGQQHFVLRARQREELAIAEGRKAPPEPKQRRGLMSGIMERANQERGKRDGSNGSGSGKPTGKSSSGSGSKSSSGSKSGTGSKSSSGSGSGKSSGSSGSKPA
ncbi:MAG TPA: YidC/Oxa1 family membrane protein insertase, partial [Actinomycetota bacterium]|nr:YidC/Oxa1 family membrane protein insertase [Actinomycetota bacterium]